MNNAYVYSVREDMIVPFREMLEIHGLRNQYTVVTDGPVTYFEFSNHTTWVEAGPLLDYVRDAIKKGSQMESYLLSPAFHQIDTLADALNKKKVAFEVDDQAIFHFSSKGGYETAKQILKSFNTQPAQSVEKTVITVESTSPKVVVGLRNLTPGAWSRLGTNETLWVSRVPENAIGHVRGVSVFKPGENGVDLLVDMDTDDWSNQRFEYLGDNLTVKFSL